MIINSIYMNILRAAFILAYYWQYFYEPTVVIY